MTVMNTKVNYEELIIKRYSCRSYSNTVLSESDVNAIEKIIQQNLNGPLGSEVRFKLNAALPGDSKSLKDLGTYGVIKNPAAFITGAVKKTDFALEDFGYLTEKIILELTSINIGTCWLGGTFKKSSFASRIGLSNNEIIPAVISLGYIADRETVTDRIMKAGAGSKKRIPGSSIFFDENLKPLNLNSNNNYSKPLEMLRLAPSASNKQPWRIINTDSGKIFHFYIERSKSSLNSLAIRLFKMADLQRIDIGIAMSHFELTAKENNLSGTWQIKSDTAVKVPEWQYIATWIGE